MGSDCLNLYRGRYARLYQRLRSTRLCVRLWDLHRCLDVHTSFNRFGSCFQKLIWEIRTDSMEIA
jgi:hypothetical protein